MRINALQFKATEQLRGDISTTERAPYPQAHELIFQRVRMMSKLNSCCILL
jgi:hypothetical protein